MRHISKVNVEILAGTTIAQALEVAQEIADYISENIKFSFNGIKYDINANTDIEKHLKEYTTKLKEVNR